MTVKQALWKLSCHHHLRSYSISFDHVSNQKVFPTNKYSTLSTVYINILRRFWLLHTSYFTTVCKSYLVLFVSDTIPFLRVHLPVRGVFFRKTPRRDVLLLQPEKIIWIYRILCFKSSFYGHFLAYGVFLPLALGPRCFYPPFSDRISEKSLPLQDNYSAKLQYFYMYCTWRVTGKYGHISSYAHMFEYSTVLYEYDSVKLRAGDMSILRLAI